MTEEKKKTFLGRVWEKTVFPDMIEEKKKRNATKREEEQQLNEVRAQARKEAIAELGPELKEQMKEKIKQEEIDKLTGSKKKDFLSKLAKGFEGSGSNMDDKLSKMLGTGRDTNGTDNALNNMLGGLPQQQEEVVYEKPKPKRKPAKKKATKKRVYKSQPPQQPKNDVEDKIKRMLG